MSIYAIALHHFTHLLSCKGTKNGPSSFGEATFYMNLSVGIIGLRFSEEQVAVGNAIVLGYTYS